MTLREYLENKEEFFWEERIINYDDLLEIIEEQAQNQCMGKSVVFNNLDCFDIEIFENDSSTDEIIVGNKIDFDEEDFKEAVKCIKENWEDEERTRYMP